MWAALFGGKKKKPGNTRSGTTPTTQEAFGPPLTDEELNANLSVLERRLNQEMVCPAGKNQVYLRSLMTGRSTTKPRIVLKCHLRKDIDQPQDVFFEEIRSLCCGDPNNCEAYRAFQERLGR
ncbi:MAG: hypothetical protein KDA32_03055 [Phycisphaerales bacterium]|nr:hypothetical protein [Phycisphaerales bacterium]